MGIRDATFRSLNRPFDHNISVNPTSVNLDWEGGVGATGEDVDITVTPIGVSWTVTKIDTGDGTSWFKVASTTGTGNDTITITPFEDNTTGATRSATARVSDDSDATVYADIAVHQITKPT